MKIYLVGVNWKSLKSVGVAYFTRSAFSHAFVEIDGKYYDSSDTRGDFNEIDPKKYRGRFVFVWKVGNRNVVRNFIESNIARQHDFKGVFTYPFRKKENRKFQAFETVLALAKLVKGRELELPNQTTGDDICEYLGSPTTIIKF